MHQKARGKNKEEKTYTVPHIDGTPKHHKQLKENPTRYQTVMLKYTCKRHAYHCLAPEQPKKTQPQATSSRTSAPVNNCHTYLRPSLPRHNIGFQLHS